MLSLGRSARNLGNEVRDKAALKLGMMNARDDQGENHSVDKTFLF
jgi:hypothetical protein